MNLARLHETVAVVCPIISVEVGRRDDRATWRFSPAPEATSSQRTAAQSAIDNYDDSAEAQAAWEEDQHPERKTLRQAAQAAVDDIDTYLAAADTGTANQIQQRDHAALKRLAQMMRQVIRRLIQID